MFNYGTGSLVWYLLCSVQCVMCSVQCVQLIVQCVVYRLHCCMQDGGIVLDVQCIVQRGSALGGAGVHGVVGAVYVRGEQHSVHP